MEQKPHSLDWFVITKKTVLMQRLADLVRTGHRWYVAGEIQPEKAPLLAGKLDALYRVDQGRLAASRERAKGLATFRLLMLQHEGQEALQWWLLRTEGSMPAEAEREKWRDALVSRIELTGYELVRLPRAGKATPAYTWRYSREREVDLRDSLLRAIRTRRDDELRRLIHAIWRTPGFAAARDQVKKMAELIRGEWKRSRGTDELPEIPQRLGYVQRLPDKGCKLSELGVKVTTRRKVPKKKAAGKEKTQDGPQVIVIDHL